MMIHRIKEDFLDLKWINKKGIIGLIAVLVIFVVLLVLPGQIPYSIVVRGKIKPVHEFILTKKTDGSVQTLERDNLLNIVSSTRIYQIERGEYAGFKLNSPALVKEVVSKSDTIGRIFSSESQLRLTDLRNRLAEAQMNLNNFRTGGKENLIEIAKRRENLYREQLDIQQKILDRKEDLFRNKLISPEEIEKDRNSLKDIQLQLYNARAEYEELSTGAKPEQLKYLESIISSIKNEINEVKNLSNNLIIVAPFSGRVLQSFNEDTLVIIADRFSSIQMPVPVKYLSELRTGQIFNISSEYLPSDSSAISGEIIRINNSIELLNQQEVVIVTGKIKTEIMDLPPNLVVTAKILLYELPLRQHIFNFIDSVFQVLF